MLSLERVKLLLNDPNISDDTALEIRDNFHSLAELIFEKWQREKFNINNPKKYEESGIQPIEKNKGY